jgi:hypothetical protein
MRKTILMAAASAALAANGVSFAAERHIAPTSAGSHAKHKLLLSGAYSTLYDQNGNDSGAGLVS